MEKITYLIANYNNGKYIADCLASLHQQTVSQWHALIVDDASTDNSLDCIKPWLSDKIQLLCNEHNRGYTSSLMRLIDHAPTDIVGILDPDDALYPEATERILAAYEEHPDAGFVYANLWHFRQALDHPIRLGESRKIPCGHTNLVDEYVSAPRTFRVSCYRQTSGYDPRILYAEDRDIIYKMEEVTKLVFIDQVLYKYRRIPGSQTTDPAKGLIGHQNLLRAYQYALQRRNIKGIRRLVYLLHIYSRYLYTVAPRRRLILEVTKRWITMTTAWVVRLEQQRLRHSAK